MPFGLESFFIFGNFSDDFYLLHNTSDVTRVARGHDPSGADHYKKYQQCHKHFFKTVHLLPKDLRFEHGGAKLVSCPKRHLTSLRPCTSRLSFQNVEICLQKYLPISGKLSITNYLKQNSVDYRSHLTTENNLKVERKDTLFRKQAQLSLPPKNAWGTRRDKHTKKLESNNYAGTLPWQVFISS